MAPSPANEISVGTLIAGTYEVVGLIARGGMGAVFEARHVRLPGKRVALKVLLDEASADSELYARFRREAEIVSRIGHPNIVEVLDFNTLGSGAPYIVLEFLQGEDLATRLGRGPIPTAVAMAMVRQIGSALHAAHRAQVVHRDLKPGNIFLCPTDSSGTVTDHVKVLDFGISKIRGSQTLLTREAVLIGTPQYMAPEQVSGKSEIDQRTDVFALGAIVYEMLCGQPAFQGQNLTEVMYKVAFEAPVPLATRVPGLPPALVAAVDRALAKDPAARFQDVASFVAAMTGRPLETLERRAPGPGASGPGSIPPTNIAHSPTAAAPLGAVAKQGAAYAATEVGPPAQPRPPQSGPAYAATQAASGLGVPAPIGAEPMPTSAARGVGRRFTIVGILVAVAAAAGYSAWRLRPVALHPPSAPPPPTAPTTAPTIAAPPRLPPPDASPASLALPVAPPDAAPPPAGESGLGVIFKAMKKPPSAGIDPPLPAEVAEQLDAAERLLAAGKSDEAQELARKTFRVRESSRAHALITRAYCKVGNLGMAKASFRQVKAKGDRQRVIQQCKAAGIDLQ